MPRTGSFEVSYKGLLIFSKLQTGYWPNSELVAQRAQNIIKADADGADVTPWLASNSKGKKRDNSPAKRGKKGSPIRDVTPAKIGFSPVA